MSVQIAPKPEADIREWGGRRQWHCPNCGQMLGEIVGHRLVIVIAGRRVLSFRLQLDTEQTCHRCHAVSVYEPL